MKLLLKRRFKGALYTIGSLYLNDKYFCDVLEDTDRGLTDDMPEAVIKALKIYGQTAIPTGTYQVTITYSNKFKKNMPLINNVKGFEGIRIHSGNTAKDTEGCLIVGENKVKGQVINSRVTYNKLYKELIKEKTHILTII